VAAQKIDERRRTGNLVADRDGVGSARVTKRYKINTKFYE